VTAHSEQITDALRSSYEATPYHGGAISGTHPDVLATVGCLRGMSPPPIANCRVLELGCGTGDNLVPMALSLPGASLLGIDLSPRQVHMAREFAEAVGLSNVRFEALGITDVDDSLGEFDYIVCHGVYSWVPADVQDAILRVCSRNLAPRGIAYVSYNSYPGWHLRGMVRDLVLFHDDATLPLSVRAARGREVVEFMSHTAPKSSELYSRILNEELGTLRAAHDSYFLHEVLESVNEPLYFTEFMRRATRHRLRYLGDSDPAAWKVVPPAVEQRLQGWARDEIQFQQYLDFLRNRTFRRTLLCHEDVQLASEPRSEGVRSLYVSLGAVPVQRSSEAQGNGTTAGETDSGHDGAEVFRTSIGWSITIDHPVVLAALHHLLDSGALQGAIPFDDLLDGVVARRAAATGDAPDRNELGPLLADAVFHSALIRLVDLHVARPNFAGELTDRPIANPIARLEARSHNIVTSMRHEPIDLSPLLRLIVLGADGSRDVAALAEFVREALRRGELEVAGSSADDPERIHAEVVASLHRLLMLGMFVS
jgi:SAM-dependent methyltransferase